MSGRIGSREEVQNVQKPYIWNLRIEQIPDKILIFTRIICSTERRFISLSARIHRTSMTPKIVSVIAVICEGHGGIFFYEVTRRALIRDVRTKLSCPKAKSDSLKVS